MSLPHVMIPSLPLTGGCQCGAVRYRLTARPLVFYLCHCTECQKQSASAFGESVRVRSADLEVEGTIASWTRSSESGNRLVCDFCPTCGTRLFHRREGHGDALNIKGGSFDDTSWLVPAGHIWTRSAQPFMRFGADDLIYEQQEDDAYAAMMLRWQAMTR